MKNNFKELEKLEMQDVSMDSVAIQNGISSDIGIMRYVSSIVDMFLPRVMEMFIGLSSGTSSLPKNKKSN